jgi:hypothetical protein
LPRGCAGLGEEGLYYRARTRREMNLKTPGE